jgi:hypothetical protein
MVAPTSTCCSENESIDVLLGSGERGSLRAAFAGEEMDHLRHPIQQRFVPGIGEDCKGSRPAISFFSSGCLNWFL